MRGIRLHDGGIKSKERSAKFGEVFMPRWMVEEMCNRLEKENTGEDCFAPETTFLDPACGEGQFPMEILRRKFRRCRKRADFETAARSVWGFDIQEDNIAQCIGNVTALCRAHFRVSKKLEKEIAQQYIQCDSLKVMPLLAGDGMRGYFVVPGPWMAAPWTARRWRPRRWRELT